MSEPSRIEPPSTGDAAAFPALYAKTRRFTVGVPRDLTVLPDGSILFLRSNDHLDPTLCLWRVPPPGNSAAGLAGVTNATGGTGDEALLVDPSRLASDSDGELPTAERARRERARESAGGIVSYSTDSCGRRACFALAGGLFVVDLASGQVSNPSSSDQVFDPRLSPDGNHVAYVTGQGLRVVDLDEHGGAVHDRTVAGETASPGGVQGSPTVQWGRAEFVAAEEMQRSRGYWWSPDNDQLLVTRTNDSRVANWWIADPAHPGREPNLVRYPFAGSANTDVELWLVALDGTRREIRWNDDNAFEYLTNIIWDHLHPPVVVRQSRDQRRVSMGTVDLEAGTVIERYTVSDEIWVELLPSSPTLCAGKLLTIEDRQEHPDDPGHRALVFDGTVLTPSTVGPIRQVNSVVGHVAQESTPSGQPHTVVVTGWTHPTEIHLFAVTFTVDANGQVAGDATIVALTSKPGVHRVVLRTLAGNNTDTGETSNTGDTDRPVQVALAVSTARPTDQRLEVRAYRCSAEDLAAGRLGPVRATLADRSQLSPFPALPTFVDLGADRLASAVFLPSDYDGESPLPVLLDPYGGPHAQRVRKTHTPHLISQWFAEQGFAVLVTDGRGTPGRGPWWERQVWGDLAGPVLDDQIEALENAAEEFEVFDLNRVAIRGWSFGGYLAALAVLRRPDRFHAAVAGAPVTTWNLYDTHYSERYLGRPDLYPQHYRTSDLLADAEKLRRPLLLIHGLADDNVVAAHTLRLSTALLAAGRQHHVLPLSGVTHMTPQESVAENLLWFQLDFLRNALGLTASEAAGQDRVLP